MQQVKGQMRLTQKLTKAAAVTDRKNALGIKESQSDLPLSTEMMDWLTHSFDVQADDASLPETISSRFIQPMNAMAVYCPTAAISASQFSATRISNLSVGSTVPFLPNGAFYSHRSNWKETFANTKIIESNNPTVEVFAATGRSSNNFAESMTMSSVTGTNDPINRLNVLWLKRKAQLECEAGDNNAALKTLDEAIAAHLGTDDYLKADLRGDVATSDAAALLDAIDDNYVRYDPSVHVKAVLIQRVYRQRIERKMAAATVLSRFYRGYLARRALWTKHDLLSQSASMIQKLVRNHLWRRNKLASRLQKWYAVWKQVHLYIKMRERHRAAIVIQRIWRGFLCRSRVTVTAILHKIMARKIQRLFRSYLLRSRRVLGLALYHKLFYLSSRVIQCAARKFQARARRRLRCQAAKSREVERCRREQEYITSLLAEDVQRTKFYVDTPPGKLHVAYTANSIAAKDALMREKHRGRYTAADELRKKEGLVAFQILNRSGDGHLTAQELMEALSELSIVLIPDQLKDLAAHMGLPLEVDGDTGVPGHINQDTFMRWYDTRKSSKFGSPVQSVAGSPTQSPVSSFRLSSATSARPPSTLQRPSSPLQSAYGFVSEVAVMTGNAIRQVLRERLYELEVTGRLLNIRAEREIARLSAELQKLKAMAVFRRHAPPRFQCCQCRATFAVFGAYHEHFPSLGRCATLLLPGMFYRKCSLSWIKQRECEEEAIRRHEEKLFLDYSLTRAWFAELSLMDNISIRSLIAKDISAYNRMAAQQQIKNEEIPLEGGGVAPKSTRSVRRKALAKRTLSGLPDLLMPVNGDPQLVQLSSALISSKLNFPMPTNWLEHDNDLVAEDIRDWMTIMLLPVPTGKAAISPVEDEDDDADGGSSSAKKSRFTWLQEKPKERKVSPYQAAELRIKLLRLLLFVSTEVLAASGEFEHLRPRNISVTDKELVAKGHKDLTHAAHVAFVTELLQGIDALRAQWRELLHATALRSGTASSLQSDSQIGSLYGTVDVMEGLVQNMELEDAYLRAHVRTSQWVHSSLGRRHISRLSSELWVAKQRFNADTMSKLDNQTTAEKKETKAGKTTSDAAIPPSRKAKKARYVFHRLVRSTWVPNNSTVSHLYGSAEAVSVAVAMMGSEALDVLGSADMRSSDLPTSKDRGKSTEMLQMTPSLSLFELHWLARAMGMHIPASQLQDVERQLDPQRSGQFTSEELLQWIGKEETGGLSSIVQSVANGIAAGTRMLTGTYYSEHARQIILLAARKRARLVLQYEHECLTDLKAGGAALKAKSSKSSKKQAKNNDNDIFHQGGGLTTQLVALRSAHESCEVALVRKTKDEEMARRRLRPRWWRRDDAAVAVFESNLLVRAVDDMVIVFGGLTRAIVLNMDQSFGETHPEKNSSAPLALSNKPNEDVDVSAAESVPLLSAPGGVGSLSPANSESDQSQQNDATDHFHILEVPESSKAEADALLAKTRDTVASLLVHLFDVTRAQDLGEDQINALLFFLQHGVSERELLRRFPGISYQKMGLSNMARFLQLKFSVLPEASVRDTSLLGKLFGTNRAFLARCSTGTAARALASMGTTEPIKLKARTIDRYWQAFGEYSTARIVSFFATKPEDDKVATILSLKEQERQGSNDLLLLHRAQLLAMRQVKLLLLSIDGKKELNDEKIRQASLWEAHCTAIMDVTEEDIVVESLIGFAFDVFACAVIPIADDEDGYGSVLVTELPFLMHFCVNQLHLVPNPELGRIFAMVLLLVEKDDISMLRRSHVLDTFRPAFHPPKPPEVGFFRRIIQRLSQPSNAATAQINAIAGIMARARQEAVLSCLGFYDDMESSDSIRRCQMITRHTEINTLRSRFSQLVQPFSSLNVHVNSALGRVESKVTSAQLADELVNGIAYTTTL